MTDDHINALPKGHRLQEYELVRVLGHGGFGITYLGYDHNLDKAVAVKEYLPVDLAGRAAGHSVVPQTEAYRADFAWGLERFLDEARTLARFKHHNIIQVHRFFEAHDTAYIVMEYAEGETLAERLKRQGALGEEELKAILLPLLDGLAQVHAAGILHRDIKPGNIMLRAADGSPALVDFGSARQAIGERSRSMTAIVTPGYGPIEQYSSRGQQGPWTDLYALGGVCYRALTGNAPAEAMDRLRDDSQTPVVEAARGKAAPAFLRAIDWALQVNEGDRPQDAAAWRTALLGKKAAPAPTKPKHPTEASSPAISSPSRQRWAIASAVVLLLTGLGWWNWQTYQVAEEAKRVAEAERQATKETMRIAEAEKQAAAEARRKAEAERQAAEASRETETATPDALFGLLKKDIAMPHNADPAKLYWVEYTPLWTRGKPTREEPPAASSTPAAPGPGAPAQPVDVSAEAVHDLIARGADVHATDKGGITPLHLAAESSEHPEIIKALIDGGADVHAISVHGATPLHGAAIHNEHPEIIQALLDAGADVNARDANRSTPLHSAAGSSKSPEIIKALLAAGADASATNEDGKTPLDIARQRKNWGVVQVLDKTSR